jgi:hypothetical protein
MPPKKQIKTKTQEEFQVRLPLTQDDSAESSNSAESKELNAVPEQCISCGFNFWKYEGAMTNRAIGLCAECNNLDSLVYKKIPTMGKVFFGYKSHCFSCENDVVIPDLKHKRVFCSDCKPKDKHHKFVLDKVYGVYNILL